MRFPVFAPLLALAVLLPAGVVAQESAPADSGWNSPRAIELIDRAQHRRAEAGSDSGLVNYEADAQVYVYFYLDRADTGERNLVKTDQLALDVLWAAPDLVKQRIVGWRDEKSLPTNIHYHLDHLTVVQENFGDEITIGDGDEVKNVLHPAAPGATSFYDYNLTDSLTLRLAGSGDTIRVYQLQVRPKDPTRPAFLGSVFVARRAGDIVRMDFTFTKAAYVDHSIDYINIALDNGLWEGRYWLPNQQHIEIRRHATAFDFPVGAVIRGTMKIDDYRFNQPLPPGIFSGPRVVSAPPAEREAFPFQKGIHAEVRDEGIGPAVELSDIQRMAATLVRREALRRIQTLRLRIPRVSDVVRYDRAEGWMVGAGATITPRSGLRAALRGGWAFGAAHGLGSLALTRTAGDVEITGVGYVNRLRDVGVGPAASGAMNSLSSLLAGEDYTEPYFASGVAVGAERPIAPLWSLETSVQAERQRSARIETDYSVFGGGFRPVHSIDETDLLVGATAELRRVPPTGLGRWWSGALTGELAHMNHLAFFKPSAELGWGRRWAARESELSVRGRAGTAIGTLPPQELYLVGGRGTVPGYEFRRYGGDSYALANVTVAANLWQPWIRGRISGAVGWTDVRSVGDDALAAWGATTTGGLKPSIGAGLGLISDILRVDLARGLARGGTWELIVEANPSFWDFL